MAKSWRKRAARRVLGWLGRIDGVEKPVILLGFGLLLYRAWRGHKLNRPLHRRLGPVMGNVRERLNRALDRDGSSPVADPAGGHDVEGRN
jgi:hypothetical protein